MGVIYANAECVIAASDAKDTSEGCFRTRGPDLTKRITVKYEATSRKLITVAPPEKGRETIDPPTYSGVMLSRASSLSKNDQIHRRRITMGVRAGKNDGIRLVAE